MIRIFSSQPLAIWMNLFLGHFEEQCLGSKLSPSSRLECPCPCSLWHACVLTRTCVPVPCVLAWLSLCSRGSFGMIVFFSLTSIRPDIYFISSFFRHTELIRLLKKERNISSHIKFLPGNTNYFCMLIC